MNKIFGTDYSSKSTALRGAKRAGLQTGEFEIQANADGRFAIVAPATEFEAPTEELAAQKGRPSTEAKDELQDAVWNNDFADKEVGEAAVKAAETVTYKDLPKHRPSLVDRPVGFVHQFLTQHPELTRKQAVNMLVNGYGVNYATARTQYQRWYSQRKG